jgi:hypothetical protein
VAKGTNVSTLSQTQSGIEVPFRVLCVGEATQSGSVWGDSRTL